MPFSSHQCRSSGAPRNVQDPTLRGVCNIIASRTGTRTKTPAISLTFSLLPHHLYTDSLVHSHLWPRGALSSQFGKFGTVDLPECSYRVVAQSMHRGDLCVLYAPSWKKESAATMATVVSFGDILTLAKLAWTLARILRESTGSSAEYQDLVAELDSLGNALQSLDQFVSNPGPTKLQSSVENAVNYALSKCRTLIAEFLKKVEGYQFSLKKGGSGNGMRDSWRKIGWGLFKKDEIKILKTQLMEQKTTINMMLTLSHCAVLERVEKTANHQQVTLAAIHCSVKQLPRSLGHTWEGGNTHKVIWFVDAVGNKLPIPIELCITRATFDGLLRVYFKNRAGNSYIEQEHYELAEEVNDEVCGIKDWDDHIRPGITITTRMIYVQWDSGSNEVCPSCQRAISLQDASGYRCSFCGTSVRDYKSLQDQFPVRRSITFENDLGSVTPAPEEQFIRRFLVRKAGGRSGYAAGQRVSYWDSLGNAVHAVVKRFGLMVQEGITVYNVHRESDGAQICLPATALMAVGG